MPTNATCCSRRLILMILLVLLGMGTGFVWGREFGYEEGKEDTIRVIEQKLAKPKTKRLPM